MIRLAEPTDAEDIRAVELDAGSRFLEIGLDRMAEDVPPPANVVMGYIDGGRAWVATDPSHQSIVGFALVSEVDDGAHLDQVSVTVGSGRSGVGLALIEATLEWAVERGHTAMTLTTFRDVAFNGPWYRRLGFTDLSDDDMGPHLAAIRSAERAAGLDVVPRIAMRIDLAMWSSSRP